MLRKTGDGWQFESEALLEDFFQANIQEILGLKILSQQHYISGQVCDLIAISQDGEIAIIELKNCEDRYIVQQLTRYFDAVLQEKPFQEVVDYSKSIKLIAVSPSFHRDNWTDRKYTRLDIDFFEYQVVQRQEKFVFILKRQDTNDAWEAMISYQQPRVDYEIPAPPRGLLNMLAKSPDVDRKGVMALREILFGYDNRIQEITVGSSILYGKNKSKLCAELKYDSIRERMALLLWLPYKTKLHKSEERITRLRVWTDWETVSALAHTPKLLGRTISVEEWQEGKLQPLKKLLPQESYRQDDYYNRPGSKENHIRIQSQNYSNARYTSGLAMTFEIYKKLTQQPELSNELSAILSLALDKWLYRL